MPVLGNVKTPEDTVIALPTLAAVAFQVPLRSVVVE